MVLPGWWEAAAGGDDWEGVTPEVALEQMAKQRHVKASNTYRTDFKQQQVSLTSFSRHDSFPSKTEGTRVRNESIIKLLDSASCICFWFEAK